jgi:hypothetical protein
MGEDMGDPDFEHHDPAGHCGQTLKGMSTGEIADDHFGGLWDADEDESLDDEYRPLTRCNRCGSRDVRWRQQTGKWVLFNLGPGEHVCPIDDPFKVLP